MGSTSFTTRVKPGITNFLGLTLSLSLSLLTKLLTLCQNAFETIYNPFA
jgi:hypothetical protein